jgi:hypothetical protein
MNPARQVGMASGLPGNLRASKWARKTAFPRPRGGSLMFHSFVKDG